MIVAAVRRFGIMLVGVGGGTVIVSALFGALAGAQVGRAIAIGLYIVGSLLMLAGFFIGNRGPFRSRTESTSFFLGPRDLRRATLDEMHEAINSSALIVSLGLGLILLGLLTDPAHKLF